MVEAGKYRIINPEEVTRKRPAPPSEMEKPIDSETESEKRSKKIVDLSDKKNTQGLTLEEQEELERLKREEEIELGADSL
jgi:hypothetical protein